MAIPTYKREDLLALIATKLAGSPNTIDAVDHRDLEEAIVNAIYGQVGDIKELAVDISYINTHFDMSGLSPGLGKTATQGGERYGWAICNGKNGTIDKRGNVSVGYDPGDANYTTLASLTSGGLTTPYKQGGAKTHTLAISEMPQHNHQVIVHRGDDLNFSASFNYTGPVGLNGTTATINGPFLVGTDNSLDSFKRNVTSNSPGDVLYSGGGSSHNNMQPYIVTLFIQRIQI